MDGQPLLVFGERPDDRNGHTASEPGHGNGKSPHPGRAAAVPTSLRLTSLACELPWDTRCVASDRMIRSQLW